jgi:hypothetical protein
MAPQCRRMAHRAGVRLTAESQQHRNPRLACTQERTAPCDHMSMSLIQGVSPRQARGGLMSRSRLHRRSPFGVQSCLYAVEEILSLVVPRSSKLACSSAVARLACSSAVARLSLAVTDGQAETARMYSVRAVEPGEPAAAERRHITRHSVCRTAQLVFLAPQQARGRQAMCAVHCRCERAHPAGSELPGLGQGMPEASTDAPSSRWSCRATPPGLKWGRCTPSNGEHSRT